jgi:hypothetical protein
MSDPHLHEHTISSLLRHLETGQFDLSLSRDRARARMLKAFDDPTDVAPPTRSPAGEASHVMVGLDSTSTQSRRSRSRRFRQTGRTMVLMAAVSIVAVAGVVVAQRATPTPGDAVRQPNTEVGSVDASNLIPGLAFDIDDSIASVDAQPSSTTIRIADPRSDGVLTMTIITVDEWGSALLPASVPEVDQPDSLRSWVGLSSIDLSQQAPIRMLDPTVTAEAWITTLPVAGTCDDENSCVVASSADGETIALSDGVTHQLVSFDFPDQMLTVLVHVSYSGDRRTGLIGEQILSTLRRS